MDNPDWLDSHPDGGADIPQPKVVTYIYLFNPLVDVFGMHMSLDKVTEQLIEKPNVIVVASNNKKIIDLPISKLKEAWTKGFTEALE